MDDARVAGSSAGLAAYRIIQEALTNVMRHQGLVPTQVELVAARRRLLDVTVSQHRPPRPQRETPRWPGAAGMRERATALGGDFEAGERDGEYVVARGVAAAVGSVA